MKLHTDSKAAALHRGAGRAGLGLLLLLVVLLAMAGCYKPVSTNSIEIINHSGADLRIRVVPSDGEPADPAYEGDVTYLGEDYPRDLPNMDDMYFLIDWGTCSEDVIQLRDDQGRVRAENPYPCGGDRWVLRDESDLFPAEE